MTTLAIPAGVVGIGVSALAMGGTAYLAASAVVPPIYRGVRYVVVGAAVGLYDFATYAPEAVDAAVNMV